DAPALFSHPHCVAAVNAPTQAAAALAHRQLPLLAAALAVGAAPCERRLCEHRAAPCPWADAAPLQVARPWSVAPTRDLAVASHLCMQTACRWPPPRPQAVLTFAANRCNKRVEQFYALQSHHTHFKPIFRTKTLALIPLLGNLSGNITCAAEIKTKIGFPCRSNRRAKDWGREKATKTIKPRHVID
ncbi:hypothetical protein BHE74_00057870, partial [Ensete ventricosum]